MRSIYFCCCVNSLRFAIFVAMSGRCSFSVSTRLTAQIIVDSCRLQNLASSVKVALDSSSVAHVGRGDVGKLCNLFDQQPIAELTTYITYQRPPSP